MSANPSDKSHVAEPGNASAAPSPSEANPAAPAAAAWEEPVAVASPTVSAGVLSAEEIAAMHGVIEKLNAENTDLRDKMLRLAAEMENLRKRTEREKQDTAKYAISKFAKDVVTIADNVQLAIKAVPVEAAASDPALRTFLDGVEMTERELLIVLERNGISRLDPKGQMFDPNKHQAMTEVENPAVPHGTVVEVYQQGFLIEDRVLRPALVVVARGGAKGQKPAGEAGQEASSETPGAAG